MKTCNRSIERLVLCAVLLLLPAQAAQRLGTRNLNVSVDQLAHERDYAEPINYDDFEDEIIHRKGDNTLPKEPPPDPFESDAFLAAQTMEEKCEVLKQAQLEEERYEKAMYGYIRGKDFYYGGSDFSDKCTNADENIRGVYYAQTKACTFSFHEVTEQETLHEHQLSTACSKSNMIPGTLFKDYIMPGTGRWQDECVGDHPRCYTVGVHEKIFLKYFCDRKKKIPDGTTHVTVDCTEDKKASKANYERDRGHHEGDGRNPSSWSREDKLRAEARAFVVISFVVVVLTGFLCMSCIHRWFWSPFLKMVLIQKSTKEGDDKEETRTLINDDNTDDVVETGHNNNTMLRRKKAAENASPA